MLLYIVRHGDPIYDPDTLTDLGRQQADALANRFAVHGLDRVYSSPQGRARETAQPAADRLGLTLQILPWTREVWPEMTAVQPDGTRRFVTEMPGRLYHTEENRHLGENWPGIDFLSAIHAGDTYRQIAEHSDAFLKELGYEREGGLYRIVRPNEEKVAVFCHAGLTMTWLPHLLGIPAHLFWAAFGLTHSGVTLLRWENDPTGYTAPKCLFLSDMSHIYKENLPMLYTGTIPV